MNQSPAPLVTIVSFSYLLGGHPSDRHGHGGGFVFDCRCLPNPGRSPRFAELDGLSAEVAEVLDADSVASAFLREACSVVMTAVAEYRRRGFHHLQVAFGCTGGQHRSVYCAHRLEEYLRRRGVSTTVVHRDLAGAREQGS